MLDPIEGPLPRRGMLGVLAGTAAATLGVLFYPVVRFLRPRKSEGPGRLEVIAPYKVNDLRPDDTGKWPAPFNFGGKPCLVIKTQEGDVRAFNAVCTHVDCTVQHRADKGDIFCSCHNGTYDLNGRNVSGPPPRPLETYRVTLKGKPGQEEIVVSRAG
jgi:cytochrome b6-f complex iron-sulfur subunit